MLVLPVGEQRGEGSHDDHTFGCFGDGGPATQAGLFSPGGVALNKTGGLVIADTSNHRIRAVSG